MTDSILVLIRDPAVIDAIKELGFKITTSSTSGQQGLLCTRAVPDWGGTFLALTPAPSALPEDAAQSRDETVRVPLHSVLLAAQLGSRRKIGFQVERLSAS
ncbi:MAG TPA: hypothetical protein VIP05_06635 [Burkholderiaceae bacterium]